jgi:hypothetical protein
LIFSFFPFQLEYRNSNLEQDSEKLGTDTDKQIGSEVDKTSQEF